MSDRIPLKVEEVAEATAKSSRYSMLDASIS